MDKKLQVFVSSTYLDLIDERQKAVEGILRSKHIPAGMELFIPSNKTQWEIIKEWIRDSDLLMLILGGRYGTIDPNSGKSYTQLEYEYAIAHQIPVFAILLNEQFLANKKSQNISLKVYEQEVTNPQTEKYHTFKKEVMSNLVSIVENINQISTEVSLALQEFISKDEMEYHFRGWVRGVDNRKQMEISLNHYVQAFLDDKKRQGLAKNTLESYGISLRIFQDYFYRTHISQIDTVKIKEFLKYREDNYSVKSRSSMESTRGHLNLFFNWLVEEEVIFQNPVKKVKPYKFSKKGNNSLNQAEIFELRNACHTKRERALLELLLSTGMRLNEIKDSRISNIDWTSHTMKIYTNDHERMVFLTKKAEEHLQYYLSQRKDSLDHLFVTERKPYRQISGRGIQREIDSIASRTNIPRNVSPKTLRNTFAKIMLERGIQTNIIELLLGYSSKETRSESYIKITKENIWELIRNRPQI